MIDFLTSPAFTAFANAIQVLGVMGIGVTVYRMSRDRQMIAIWAECEDGRRKAIGEIPRRVLTRAEVTGWISMKAGRPRLDFTKFNPDYEFPSRQVVVPLNAADFDLLSKDRDMGRRRPRKRRQHRSSMSTHGGRRDRKLRQVANGAYQKPASSL